MFKTYKEPQVPSSDRQFQFDGKNVTILQPALFIQLSIFMWDKESNVHLHNFTY